MAQRTTRTAKVRVQLDDVARAAGVSSPTASKILNNVPTLSVKPETRERVLLAARSLGYRPHAGARALAGARSSALAFLIPELSNSIYALMVRGAAERAYELGYTVLISEDAEGRMAGDRFEQLIAAGHVDGLLIASARADRPRLRTLDRDEVPHVFVNRAVPGSDHGVYMRVRESADLAARRLAAAGHRHLGHISGPLDVETSRARAEGFVASARALGLPEPVVANAPAFDERAGFDALGELLAREPRISAVFSTSVYQVVGVLHRAHMMGLSVPHDLSVLAYDDLPIAAYLIPPVTTIAMPLIELGVSAVDALAAQINGAAAADVVVSIAPRIVERSSVAPPRLAR